MKSNIMEMKKIDLRTPLQRERAKRDIEIHSDYKEILSKVPKTATKWAIYRTLAELHGLKPQGIRSILEKDAPTE